MTMAKRKSPKSLPEFREVIQVSLTEDMTDKVIAYAARKTDVLQALLGLPEEGFIVQIAPNPLGGMTASIRDARHESPNAGLMFFGNAPDALGALAVCLVKLDFLSTEENWHSLTSGKEAPKFR